MNSWDSFNWYAIATLLCWLSAFVLFLFTKKTGLGLLLTALGFVIFGTFIALLWVNLERPPMRTMGETRLWYSFFIVLVGSVIYAKWQFKWMLSYSLFVAMIFVIINILKPEIHSKNLMPALQSIWFVPHVTAYILSYAILGAATIVGIKQLYKYNENEDDTLIEFTDNLVFVGFGLLMLGMLMGAVWAKAAWGHYWSWDPKETWAFVTAASYLFYIHIRWNNKYRKTALWMLILAFICLMITWKGVNYLPSAKNSVHVYGQ
jgi:ABC-type transport system involved in cytochrome c biogenesis permease subunit